MDIKNGYDKTYGMWWVTTEGDCEGKTTVYLGTYEGHIDEIALYLANKSAYSLHFTLIEKVTKFEPTRNSVSVTMDISSGTWDMDNKRRKDVMSKVFKDRPVSISEGNTYAGFIINGGTDVCKKELKDIICGSLNINNKEQLKKLYDKIDTISVDVVKVLLNLNEISSVIKILEHLK